MMYFIVFCAVLVGTSAKPRKEYEIQADLMQSAREVLDSMLYAKEYAHLQRSSDDETSSRVGGEHRSVDWDMYSALDDGGVTQEYFQSFMVAEMADILLEAPLGDNVQSDEGEPVSVRFFCGRCFIKHKACKDVCFGLVAVSADHAIDFVPCSITCLQRLSTCCVAREHGKGHHATTTPPVGTMGTIAAAAAALAQAQAAAFGGGKFGHGHGAGLAGSGGKFGQAQGAVLTGSGGKFGQAQGAVLTGSGGKFGQAQGAVLPETGGKLGQPQGTIQGGETGNLKGTGSVFGQASLFGVNVGQIPGLNLEGLPEKLQALFGGGGGVEKDKVPKAPNAHSTSIADINPAIFAAVSTDSTTSTTCSTAHSPTQHVESSTAVTSVFTTTSEYTVPTVQTVTSEYTVTSVHTTTSEYHVIASPVVNSPVVNSPVVSPPVYPY